MNKRNFIVFSSDILSLLVISAGHQMAHTT